MDSPLVSIVCDVYNHRPFLEQCLDGFVRQKTSFLYEILIHDDASTDGSVDIIKKYVSLFPGLFKPVYQTENQYSKGVSIWYTIQFPRAKGKYIALCEGDDYWIDPYKLQKQVDYMEMEENCVLSYHNAVVDSGGRLSLFNRLEVLDRTVTLDCMLNDWSIPTASVMFRKEALFLVSPFPSFENGDYALELMLFSCGKFHYDPSCGSVYRKHKGSLSDAMNQNKAKLYSGLIDLLEYCKTKYSMEEQSQFDLRITKYEEQVKKERLMKKYPFLAFLSWRYYKRLIFRLLKIKRVAE